MRIVKIALIFMALSLLSIITLVVLSKTLLVDASDDVYFIVTTALSFVPFFYLSIETIWFVDDWKRTKKMEKEFEEFDGSI